MRDILAEVNSWLAEEETRIALATVIQTWGSAPRGVGAKMAITPDGRMAGSVSGGCVEGAVFDAGSETLSDGRPQLLHFGVADETAWDVGLACGGTIEVFVEPLDEAIHNFIHRLLTEDQAFATATVIGGPDELLGKKLVVQGSGSHIFGAVSPELDGLIASAARSTLHGGQSKRIHLTLPDAGLASLELFVEVSAPPPSLVMVGGVHIAIALTAMAKTLGYQTIVVDPRRAFGSQARFPHVDELIQAWPDVAFERITLTPSTAVVLLTHDPKIDDPALKQVLGSPAFYIGALGSKKTHAKRRQRLLSAGVPEERVDRIRGPVGLDIGAQTPEEIAVSILGEIVAARHGR